MAYKKYPSLPEQVWVGYRAEQHSRNPRIEISEVLADLPNGTPQLLCMRPGETTAYLATITMDGSTLVWNINGYDTEKRGVGAIQVLLTESGSDIPILMSQPIPTYIDVSIYAEDAEVPDPWESWLSQILAAASRAESAAQEAEDFVDSIPQDYNTLAQRVDDFEDDLVMVQETEPSSEENRIWVQPKATEYQIPTMDDLNAVGDEVDGLKSDFNTSKIGFLDTNCAEMVSLLSLPVKISGGVTFTPSNNGKTITATGEPTGTYQYAFVNGNITDYPFIAGKTYRIMYSAPAGAYLQIICNNSNVVLNTPSFDGIKEVTIPNDTTKLKINIYCLKTVPRGVHTVSIINARELDYLEHEEFTKHPTSAELLEIVGYTPTNIFSGIETTPGKYVRANDGKLVDLSSYSATDYFKVIPGASYKLSYLASGSQIAFYDFDKNYVTGFVTGANTFTVPNNDSIVFARWCADTANLASWGLYIVPITDERVKYITPSEGILEGLIDAYSKHITNVFVQSGVYDIIAEYEAHFGADYFTNYADNFNGKVNGNYDLGIWLDNINITFASGATVNCNYTGSNSNVKLFFSAFAIGENVTIDGLVLDASELRYGIHPDYHKIGTDTLTIKNCDLHHYKQSSTSPNNNQAIGAGLGVYSSWKIENCIFRSDTSNPVLRIHNNVSSNAKSKILIKDCYIIGDGYILLNSYSTSTKQTMALVTGCSWKTPATVGKETQASNDNITMLAWNNEART